MTDKPDFHTPYDGSAPPFAIGLNRLDPETWLDIDGDLASYTAEKHRLTRERYEDVFVAEPDTEDAQREVHDLIRSHLGARFKPAPPDTALTAPDGTPLPVLHRAALSIPEDLVLMRKGETGWRLAAASVCFPSSWNLREKFGHPMHVIHGPVPGFQKGTRNAGLIERMFDNLRLDMPVVRWNWSVYGDAELFHQHGHEKGEGRFGPGPVASNVYLRLERQTLRKLPESGDIVFTIRIYIDPLTVLETHPEAAKLALAIANQVKALSPAERAYKGLATEQDRLLARLEMIGGSAAN
ncbi:heme-dependent oxidative N-demethylase family protein [Hoeflea sp.]|uniref:heme-dependent oxidative N-demethylase family protein n=1 Tax=Hoeflea sp. TaxID=1940281 RepID=UPI003747C499